MRKPAIILTMMLMLVIVAMLLAQEVHDASLNKIGALLSCKLG
jgi:hypothetical protein